jgi:lactobin A/cerein 7B family class IIb bacteriocin
MTALALGVRELTVEEVEEVSGAVGPVGAAVGAVIGGLSAAGATAASQGTVYEISGHAVAGALFGGAMGFFSPGGTAGLAVARSAIRGGQAGWFVGLVGGGVTNMFRPKLV